MGLIMFKWNKMPVYFDGHDISSVMNITNLNRGIGTSRKNSLLKAGNQKGTQYKNYTYDEKVIPMSFSLNSDLINKRREVARILSVNEPKRLIFGDEPDKYYMAVPDGDIDLDEAAAIGKGVINWIVPDGVAHSINTQIYESDIEKPGEIKVYNNGTESTKPIIKVKMKSENGFIGIIDNDGNIIQIGDPTELDEKHYKKTDKVIWEKMKTQQGWMINGGTIVYPNYQNNPNTPNIIAGSWDWKSATEACKPIFDSPKTGVWVGPSMYRGIPSNSNGENFGNFDFRARFHGGGKSNNLKNVFRTQFQINNGKQNIFAIILRDSYNTKNQLRLEFWVYGKKVDDIRVDMKKVSRDFFEVSIVKYGDTASFDFSVFKEFSKTISQKVIPSYSIKRTHTVPGLSTQTMNEITQWMSIVKPNPATNNMYFADTKFYWLNVDKTENIPNTFDEDDELIIDTRKGEVYLNGILRDDLNNVGNRWSSFHIPPGASYIFTTESDWVTEKPHYEVLFGEVWL